MEVVVLNCWVTETKETPLVSNNSTIRVKSASERVLRCCADCLQARFGDDQRYAVTAGAVAPAGLRSPGRPRGDQFPLDQGLEYRGCGLGFELDLPGQRQDGAVLALGGSRENDQLGIGELGHGVLLVGAAECRLGDTNASFAAAIQSFLRSQNGVVCAWSSPELLGCNVALHRC
jgi:hypothetical protein